MKGNQWASLLAYVTGLVNQELLLQNEYLVASGKSIIHRSARDCREGRALPVITLLFL
jgi:hypothetical protein